VISLREVTRDNWLDIIRLKVCEAQQNFVASNAISLAEAYVHPECVPLAIYDDDTPVGFCMYAMDSDDKEYWIFRLMVDARYQSKGYGGAAMRMLIERIKQDKAHHKIYISFEPENDRAKGLYESLGFVPDGRVVGGEIVYRLDY
jgi:diamine N-acetyltransferase